MAYDSARQTTVLFGGLDSATKRLADTWEYDGRNWTQIKQSTSPSARQRHSMVYDSARQRVALFGGNTSVKLGDTWEYGIPNLTLKVDTPTISILTGGTQTLTLNAGTDLKSKSYWIFGSATSTMPGIVLTGIHIPLVPDVYTNLLLGVVNSPTSTFKNFKGTLSATGTAIASITIPANLPGDPDGVQAVPRLRRLRRHDWATVHVEQPGVGGVQVVQAEATRSVGRNADFRGLIETRGRGAGRTSRRPTLISA